MKTQQGQQFVSLKMLDCIQMNPSTILNLFVDQLQKRLYVSREKYSEIYEISQNEENGPVMQQIAELESSIYFINVENVMGLFKPFQLRVFRNGRWEDYSFTTQLLSIRVSNQTVYSFHQKQTISWHFQQDHFSFKYLTENQTLYHIDAQGSIVGYGKKVRQVNKGSRLTRCEVMENLWVFVGDDRGGLHVYDWKFLSHVKSFHEHQAAILAIKVSPQNNTVYFSGSDSRICLIRLVGDEWRLGQSVRGQSHDVLTLGLLGGNLMSGGITTDFCFYPLHNGEFEGSFVHRVSFFCSNRISSEGKLVVVNHRNYFQIWQIGLNIHRTSLLVTYQMPAQKFIIDCKLFPQQIQENTYLLLVITDQDAVGWKFNKEKGLVKYITISNQYNVVELLPKHGFLGVRRDGLVERVSCLNGKIEELIHCEVEVPTDIQYLGNGFLLVGSRVSKSINILNIRTKELMKQFSFKNTYTYIDHISHDTLLIQYFNNPQLYSFDIGQEKQTQLVRLPVNLLRFGGWLSSVSKMGDKQAKSKQKKYWFGVSEGKIVIVANLLKEGKKKVRVKQIDRIAQVIRPTAKSLGCNLAVIPYNFTRMVNELPVKPVFTKKIV